MEIFNKESRHSTSTYTTTYLLQERDTTVYNKDLSRVGRQLRMNFLELNPKTVGCLTCLIFKGPFQSCCYIVFKVNVIQSFLSNCFKYFISQSMSIEGKINSPYNSNIFLTLCSRLSITVKKMNKKKNQILPYL